MSNKSQFLKNNVAKVISGSGGNMGATPGARSGSGGTLNAPLKDSELGHGNSATKASNNKGSRSKLCRS